MPEFCWGSLRFWLTLCERSQSDFGVVLLRLDSPSDRDGSLSRRFANIAYRVLLPTLIRLGKAPRSPMYLNAKAALLRAPEPPSRSASITASSARSLCISPWAQAALPRTHLPRSERATIGRSTGGFLSLLNAPLHSGGGANLYPTRLRRPCAGMLHLWKRGPQCRRGALTLAAS
jgi:hypothetical protein